MNKTTRFFCLCGLVFSLGLAGCGDDDTSMGDSGPADAGDDAAIACAEDTDCSDGLFCTGEESCVEGACVAGEPVVCDDMIACTVDACDEIRDRCESLAPDLDEDGVGDAACLGADGEPLGLDCDDAEPLRFAGNLEVCDSEGFDEDCDFSTFGAIDNDGDSYFDARCFNTDESGEVFGGDDCDDGRSDVNPATTEVCDRVDNNCDGNIDEGVLVTVAPDRDRDGFPADGETSEECPGFAGLIAIDEDTLFDCADDNPARNPGQVEVCDLADNDCDEDIDEAAQSVEWFRDNDGDGFGSRDSGVTISCEPVSGSVLLGTDCDDMVAGVNPAAAEVCNAQDDDCNGRADFIITDGDFEDDDGDGAADISCGLPAGIDCDDRDAQTAAGTQESCDGRDNDCDERVDEGATELTWYYDGDRDGHGTFSDPLNPPVTACSPPPGYVGSGGDCDDMDEDRSPNAAEVCSGTDIDCDGAVDEAPAMCDCPGNLRDCDGDGTCETDIATDPGNCGACAAVDPSADCRSLPNVGDAICASQRCIVFRCDPTMAGVPTDDCDEDPTNGCEALNTAANCGSCGRDCGGGSCNPDTLQCDCPADQESCGDGCRPINTLTDCGGCGRSCTDGMCVSDGGGGFQCECGVEQVACLGPDGGACFPSDSNNCGGCNRTCTGGQVCDDNGTASFAADDRCECTNTSDLLCPGPTGDECTPSDNLNCGRCGNVCTGACNDGGTPGDAFDDFCECGPGELSCGGPEPACIPSDANNCGSCGNQCPAFGTCIDPGTPGIADDDGCVCDSPTDVVCDGPGGPECRPLGSAVDCGFCGDACSGLGRSCNDLSGAGIGPFECGCSTPGDQFCDGSCVDLDSDPLNCGGCGIECGVGGACGLGVCDPVLSVGQGERHSCALRGSGAVVCWGDNSLGQITGTAGGTALLPTEVVALAGPASQLTVGFNHTCAVINNGVERVQCWGDNANRQLGAAGAFVLLNFGEPVREIAAGAEHTCAVTDGFGANTEDVLCWGNNSDGQSGQTPVPAPPAGAPVNAPTLMSGTFGNFDGIALGANFTCYFPDTGESPASNLECWGANTDEQFGTTSPPFSSSPLPVFPGFTGFGPIDLSLGNHHACAVQDGTMRCWGKNDLAQATGSVTALPATFTETGPSGFVDQVVTRANASCVLMADRSVWCAGDNELPGIGTGGTLVPGATASTLPWTRVTQLGNAVSELGEGGVSHGCALTISGDVFCWGDGESGRLGNGSGVSGPFAPLRVRDLTP